MKQYLEFKNFSTILNSILLTIFGLIIGYATSKGLNLPVTAETLTSITTGLILCIFSYYNAKHQNNLFNKEKDTIYLPVDILTPEQVKLINEYIDKTINGEANVPTKD